MYTLIDNSFRYSFSLVHEFGICKNEMVLIYIKIFKEVKNHELQAPDSQFPDS